MTSKRKAQICTLLKGIEIGDEGSVAVVNPEKYIQHNPQTYEGGGGLAVLFKRISKTSPRVNIVRIFCMAIICSDTLNMAVGHRRNFS